VWGLLYNTGTEEIISCFGILQTRAEEGRKVTRKPCSVFSPTPKTKTKKKLPGVLRRYLHFLLSFSRPPPARFYTKKKK